MPTCVYKIIAVVIFGILLILFTILSYYFFRLKNGKSLSSFEINSMYIICLIFVVILVLLFSFGIYQASVDCGVDKKVKEHYEYYKKGKTVKGEIEE